MGDQNTGTGWHQVNLRCDDWQAAERMAVTHLGPLLTEAEDTGCITCWWFVRKGESWRLRFLPVDGRDEAATTFLYQMTTALIDRGAIRRYTKVIYEPEIHAFGREDAMALAHDLFHSDGRQILRYLALAQVGTDHRRELGLRLGTQLMRAAGQDSYEQGDIWAQVAAHHEHRPTNRHQRRWRPCSGSSPRPATPATARWHRRPTGRPPSSAPAGPSPTWPSRATSRGECGPS